MPGLLALLAALVLFILAALGVDVGPLDGLREVALGLAACTLAALLDQLPDRRLR